VEKPETIAKAKQVGDSSGFVRDWRGNSVLSSKPHSQEKKERDNSLLHKTG
jgi:hypothetical protein